MYLGDGLLRFAPPLNDEGGTSAGNSERIPLHVQVSGDYTINISLLSFVSVLVLARNSERSIFVYKNICTPPPPFLQAICHPSNCQACEENWPPLHQLEGKLSPADMAKLGTLLSKYQVIQMIWQRQNTQTKIQCQ